MTTRRPSAVSGEFSVFRCTSCGNRLIQDTATEMACDRCGATVPTHDGITDFVGGAAKTELDNIDYDQVYGINEEHSLGLYHLLQRSAGPLWPKDFGTALEVGCGTGGLSLALLRHVSAWQVVLTDVSPKMLRICRERLRRAGDARVSVMTFATYSGTEDCFRPNVFDTCYGTSVVHHITDVERFLGQVHTVLKPGGRAFFMEPNLEFHRALIETMADIVTELLRNRTVCDTAISLMLNWTGEVHCNIANTGDIEVLAEREDKHLFVADTFETWAETAGFAGAAALPCDLDPTGWGTIQAYLRQTGLDAEALAALRQWWPAKHVRHFARLAERDQSPSYLFWLRKPLHRVARPAKQQPTAALPVPGLHLPTRAWLTLGLHRRGRNLQITAAGWCLSGEPVRSVQISARGVTGRVPIWRPRPDVQMGLNGDGAYPPLRALCSGIDGTVCLGGAGSGDDSIRVTVHIVAVDGTLLPWATVSLTAGGEHIEISRP